MTKFELNEINKRGQALVAKTMKQVSVDARGATLWRLEDIEAIVNRAIQKALPRIVAASRGSQK
jgi:hypothetical protein